MESTNTNHRSENLSIPQSKDTKTNGLNNFSDAIDDALQSKKHCTNKIEKIIKSMLKKKYSNLKLLGDY